MQLDKGNTTKLAQDIDHIEVRLADLANELTGHLREVHAAIKAKNGAEATGRCKHTAAREKVIKNYKNAGPPEALLRWLYDVDALPERRAAAEAAIQ